ncbi:MAG: DUF488 domain-containing protein [Phycisphaeraceae bacterium]|nr:DUF488 domain-containing protein [Phycisphaeraceae bacterium]
MNLYTLGFSGKSAQQFFDLLRQHHVRRLLDTRLWNRSQLAGFTKQDDLAYFCRTILGIDYQHLPLLAPSKELLEGYKAGQITWQQYVPIYRDLLEKRHAADVLSKDLFADACLLCAEPTAEQCHRRLAAEYFQRTWGDITITHI